mgnify:CR=1 FL=1
MIRVAIAAALSVGLTACASTQFTKTPAPRGTADAGGAAYAVDISPTDRCEIRLTASVGGGLRETGLLFQEMLDSGCAIIWDGFMVSADAFYVPAAVKMSGGCYTANATWHPHMVSMLGLPFLPYEYATAWAQERVMIEPFKSRFENSFHRYNPITVAFYSNDEIRAMWPEFACQEKPQ